MSPAEIVLIAVVAPLALGLFAFWIWMLVDCLRDEVLLPKDRAVWCLAIVFLKLFGAGIYYFYHYRPRRLAASP
jgi:hypothetical protein